MRRARGRGIAHVGDGRGGTWKARRAALAHGRGAHARTYTHTGGAGKDLHAGFKDMHGVGHVATRGGACGLRAHMGHAACGAVTVAPGSQTGHAGTSAARNLAAGGSMRHAAQVARLSATVIGAWLSVTCGVCGSLR